MFRILVPIDGSSNSLRALNYALGKPGQLPEAEIHLLNVQPPIISGTVHLFISKATVDSYYREEGEKALRQATEIMEKSGLQYVSYMDVGPVAETVARYATEKQCGLIVMGTRGQNAMSRFMLGSVTIKVLQMIDVPITLIK